MATVRTDDKHYKNIANAIRKNAATDAKFRPDEIPGGIVQVYEKGYEMGKYDGFGEGHVEGVTVGESIARQAFWDSYQQTGTRTNYNLAFSGEGWNEDTFWPHYNITVGSGYQMFAYFAFSGSLKQRLAACKVSLSFGGDQTIMNLFGYADKITELGVMDFSQVTLNSSTHVFNQCKSLKTIEKLIIPPGQATWASWFDGCSALETVIFQGVITTGGLNLSAATQLSVESMRSVLNCLADMGGTTSSSRKITFGATNLAKLSASDKAIATQKGWSLA